MLSWFKEDADLPECELIDINNQMRWGQCFLCCARCRVLSFGGGLVRGIRGLSFGGKNYEKGKGKG